MLNECACILSCVELFAVPWTVALQAPLSMEFSSQEYWGSICLHPEGRTWQCRLSDKESVCWASPMAQW